MLRWNLRQESPIPLKCWHSNKSLLFHQHLSHKFGFLEVCSQACIRLQENRLIVAGSLKLFSMDFSVTVVSIIYLNICNYTCVYLCCFITIFYTYVYLFKTSENLLTSHKMYCCQLLFQYFLYFFLLFLIGEVHFWVIIDLAPC